ncbi:MAG: TonB-dependent receptor [Ignavibacteria bacterium]|nr:TonB-dependent receptor [Ignavibacteria bacterium]
MKTNFLYLIIIFLSFFITANSFSQNSKISGKVFDSDNKLPLNGVLIFLDGNYLSSSTNSFGEYSFAKLFAGNYKVRIESIGFKKQILNLTLKNNETIDSVIYLQSNPLHISQIDVTSSNDYGKINVSPIDVKLRPTNTAQDFLKIVPGLFIAQHAGGGKAEQIFLRGFDIDHGTDINIMVDGMPVNMVSHAHGQGYADLHFVIPETIDKFSVYKGPYYSKFGDLGTSGTVNFSTLNSIQKSTAEFDIGKYNTYRGVLILDVLSKKGMLKTKKTENLYIASEYAFSDGYFEAKQDYKRFNIFGKYFGLLSKNTLLSISASAFQSKWNASGQVPQRAIDSNYITRFGSIDASEGGNTNRANVNVSVINSFKNNRSLTNQIYYTNYGFNLFSNFTFFLNDSINGDQINQFERRNIFGYNGSFSFLNRAGSVNFTTTFGIGARFDNIDSIFLAHTKERTFLNYFEAGKIFQKNIFGYINETFEFDNLIINPGLRVDYFNFNLKDDLDDKLSGDKSAIKFSPKLNLFYNVRPKTQIYVKSGIGFHSNDARVAVNKPDQQTLPSAYGLETGTSFSAGNALIGMSIWSLFLESEFVYVGDEAVVEPSGRTQRLGLDFTARYQFNNWLWADLDLNYALGKFVDENEEANKIPLAPVFTSVGGLSFKFTNGINGRIGYRYLDDRPANELNSVIAKGYFVMDAMLNYTNDRYNIGFTVDNLLDNKNWNEAQFDTESKLQFEKTPVSELHYTPGTPFSFKIKAGLYF